MRHSNLNKAHSEKNILIQELTRKLHVSETYVISLQASVDNLTTICKELRREVNKADELWEAVEPLYTISGINELRDIQNWQTK